VTFNEEVKFNSEVPLEEVTEDMFKISITNEHSFTWTAVIVGQVMEVQLNI